MGVQSLKAKMNYFHVCHAWMPEMVLSFCDSGSSLYRFRTRKKSAGIKQRVKQSALQQSFKPSRQWGHWFSCSDRKTKHNAKVYSSLGGAQKARLSFISVNLTVCLVLLNCNNGRKWSSKRKEINSRM